MEITQLSTPGDDLWTTAGREAALGRRIYEKTLGMFPEAAGGPWPLGVAFPGRYDGRPMRQISPYPWDALDAVSRASLRAGAAARRRLARALDPAQLAGALGDILSSETSLIVRRVRAHSQPRAESGVHIGFEPVDGSAELHVYLENDLAAAMVSLALGRRLELASPDAPLEPGVSGALAALGLEVTRRAGTFVPLAVRRGAPSPGPGVEVDVTVLIDGHPYAAAAWAQIPPEPTREEPAPLQPARLEHLLIPLGLVVGCSLASRADIAALGPGDAWMPGDGWWIDSEGRGSGALAAPLAEAGVGVTFPPAGGIVLRGDSIALQPDATMAESDDTGVDTLGEAALDAPVVVRVELGSVTLSARQWAELEPGDVIETGRRIGEPVVLRVAGRTLARGELVNVEGELGVRIRELAGETPE